MRQAECELDCGDAVSAMHRRHCSSGTFEPLLGGDRQTGKSVAKARNPLQVGYFEVSLS
jgi:hypothetical protein